MVQKTQKAVEHVLIGERDERPRWEKQAELRRNRKISRLERLLSPIFNTERKKYIKWKIAQYKSRGNLNKARIYELKLKG